SRQKKTKETKSLTHQTRQTRQTHEGVFGRDTNSSRNTPLTIRCAASVIRASLFLCHSTFVLHSSTRDVSAHSQRRNRLVGFEIEDFVKLPLICCDQTNDREIFATRFSLVVLPW